MPETIADDLPAFFGLTAGLTGLIGLAELLRGKLGVPVDTTRRLTHVGTGLACAAVPFVFRRPELVYALAGFFTIVNLASSRNGWFPSMHGVGRRSVGTSTFPLALIFALAVGWSMDPDRAWTLTPAFLVLAVADPLAAAVGGRASDRGRLTPGLGSKSIAGSCAFLLSALIVATVSLALLRARGVVPWSATEVAGAAVLLACVTTAAEALGSRGWDNLTIILAAIILLIYFDEHPASRAQLIGALGLAVAFALFAWRVRFLDASGATAAGLLAISVVGLGGWGWAAPSFAFFFLSSLLSKARSRAKAHSEERYEKGSVRDAGQVYANGGVGWGLLLLYAVWPHPALYWAFLGAFAAAAADTWATEIGGLSGAQPRMVTSFQKVASGTSGAVSIWGLLGAFAGALTVWLVAVPFAPENHGSMASSAAFIGIVGGGFMASLVDSLAGALFQVQYRDAVTGLPTERAVSAGQANLIIGGYPWMKNDAVNLVCTATGGAAAAVGYLLASRV